MKSVQRAAVVTLVLARTLAMAADGPTDRFELWSTGLLPGANVFQGRNPDGASNGIGDGDR